MAVVGQLPIYGEPEPVQFEHIPEWETAFHRQVSRARKWTWSYLDSMQVYSLSLSLYLLTFFNFSCYAHFRVSIVFLYLCI